MSRYWSSSDSLFVEMILKVGCVFVNATVRGILKPGSWTVYRTWKIGGQHVGVIMCTPLCPPPSLCVSSGSPFVSLCHFCAATIARFQTLHSSLKF